MLQLRNSKFSGKNKGFALSLDTLFALIILFSVIAYVGLGLQTQTGTITASQQVQTKKILDDSLTALDNTGKLGELLVDTSSGIPAAQISDELEKSLPKNMQTKIKITRYEPKGTSELAACRASKTFEGCFQQPGLVATYPDPEIAPPEDKEVYYTSQVFMKRQPYEKGAEVNQCFVEPEISLQGSEAKKGFSIRLAPENQKLSLQEPKTTIFLRTSVKDNAGNSFNETTNKMRCFDAGTEDRETAIVTLEERSGSRTPVAVMAVIDKSGSMGITDMLKQTYSSTNFDAGACLPNPPGSCTLATNNCGNYTDWILGVGSYDVSGAVQTKLMDPLNTLVFANRNYSPTSGYVCSNPKIGANQGGTLWYDGSNNINSATWAARIPGSSVSTGLWTIDLWSDLPATITKPVWVGINFAYRGATATDNYVTGHQGTTCLSGSSDWEEIANFTISSDAIDSQTYSVSARVYHNYSAGEGNGVKIRIHSPTGVLYESTQTQISPIILTAVKPPEAGKPAEDPFNGINAPFNPVYLPTGTYKIEACSDKDITISSRHYAYNTLLAKIDPPPVGYGPYDNGKCNGATCAITTIDTCNSPDSSTYVALNNLSITRNLRGLKANITAISYVSPPTGTGTCSFPRFTLSAPSVVTDTAMNGQKPNTNRCILIRNITNSLDSCSVNKNTASNLPIPQGNWILKGWSNDNIETYTIDWKLQRIDATIEAAETFVNNAEWKEDDKMGIAAYSDNSTLTSSLTLLDPLVGKPSLINALSGPNSFNSGDPKNLNPSGRTNIAAGIATAKAELDLADAGYSKAIVLLSDGQANNYLNGTQCGSDTTPCIQEAIDQGNIARNAGISVYTIGFGTDVAEEDLQEIAKDPCSGYDESGNCLEALEDSEGNRKYPECFTYPATLELNPAAHCGRYYFASDAQTLQQVYDLIAKEIGTTISGTAISVTPPEGMEVCACGVRAISGQSCSGINSVCSGECSDPADWKGNPQEIVFTGVDLSGDYAAQCFKARLACSGSYCEEDTVEFPPISTEIQKGQDIFEWGGEGTVCSCPGCSQTNCTNVVPFEYRDLKIEFTDGTISGGNTSLLDYKISNKGAVSAGTPLIQIGFYEDPPEKNQHLDVTATGSFPDGTGSISSDGNFLWQGAAPFQGNAEALFDNTHVDGIGYIYGVMSWANDCSLHNIAKIMCLGTAKVYYFKIEYWAWQK